MSRNSLNPATDGCIYGSVRPKDVSIYVDFQLIQMMLVKCQFAVNRINPEILTRPRHNPHRISKRINRNVTGSLINDGERISTIETLLQLPISREFRQ